MMPLPDAPSCRWRGTPRRFATFIVAGLAVTALLTADLGGQAVRETPFDAYLSRMRAQGLVPDRNETLSRSYRGSLRDNEAYQKLPAIEVFDNLFYVGPGFVSVWLIPTSDGLILVDTAQEPYVDHVIENVRQAGFDPEDIRYILISHGHLDHHGGAGKIQALSGARIAALEEDWQPHRGRQEGGTGQSEPSARDVLRPRHGPPGWPDPDAWRHLAHDPSPAGTYRGLALFRVHGLRRRHAARRVLLRWTGTVRHGRGFSRESELHHGEHAGCRGCRPRPTAGCRRFRIRADRCSKGLSGCRTASPAIRIRSWTTWPGGSGSKEPMPGR